MFVDGKPRILGAGGCGSKEGLYQPGGVGIASGSDGRVVQALGDLPDHLADAVHLNGALIQQTPHFGHQAVQQAFVPQVGDQIPVEFLNDHPELFRAFPIGFSELTRQQVQVQGHHLGEEVSCLLGGNAGMEIIATGDGQHAQLADGLNDGGDRTGLPQGVLGQCRLQDGRLSPVAGAENARGFQRADSPVQGIEAPGQGHQHPRALQKRQAGRFWIRTSGAGELGQRHIQLHQCRLERRIRVLSLHSVGSLFRQGRITR